MRRTELMVCLFVALLLGGCGLGRGDEILFSSPSNDSEQEYDGLDEDLLQALTAAGVQPISKPQPEAPALVELGEALFFDKELSGNRNISCATCHHPAAFTGDSLPVSLGEGGSGLGANRTKGAGMLIPRNAPHVFNAGVTGVHTMFWDSRVRRDPATGELSTPEPGLDGPTPALAEAEPLTSALAAQAMFPVTSNDEMRGKLGTNEIANAADNAQVWERLMLRLGMIAEYRDLFAAAYPAAVDFSELNFGHAARAIAAFERERWTALQSPFDKYIGGDPYALTQGAKKGAMLFFGRANCASCHDGPLLTNFEHHALAVPQLGPGKDVDGDDLGLALETGLDSDNYKFRTPSLRNVALTGPWMHDGAFTSLEAAVRHHLDPESSLRNYDATQLPALFRSEVDSDPDRQDARVAAIDPLLNAPLGLSDQEFGYLMEFLHALTDPASINLLPEIPDSVPSGLPVKD